MTSLLKIFKIFFIFSFIWSFLLANTNLSIASSGRKINVNKAEISNLNYLPVFRFWSDSIQAHFFTINSFEKKQILQKWPNTWSYEGIVFRAVPSNGNNCPNSLHPVYRFWSDKNQAHFFTINGIEKSQVQTNLSHVWQYEGIAFCAATSKIDSRLNPVYRFWSDKNQAHFYTINYNERVDILRKYDSYTWRLESTAFYALGASGLITPDPVGVNCPLENQACVPCYAGDQYCRIEAGKDVGFKGWACQNNNPGNIRYSDFRNSIISAEGAIPSCGERGGYMVFKDYSTGRNGLKAYMKAIKNNRHGSYLPECQNGNCSLKTFFSIYAPAGDQNNPDSYSNNVANRIGVNSDSTTLAWVLDNKFDQFINAIQIQEGWFIL